MKKASAVRFVVEVLSDHGTLFITVKDMGIEVSIKDMMEKLTGVCGVTFDDDFTGVYGKYRQVFSTEDCASAYTNPIGISKINLENKKDFEASVAARIEIIRKWRESCDANDRNRSWTSEFSL